LLAIFSSTHQAHCLGQSPAKMRETVKGSSSNPRREPPFDKLELFGFLVAAPAGSYARQVIHARGTDFAPDESFIASFRDANFQEILSETRPQTLKVFPADRAAAYVLLRQAWEAKQNRQIAAASESYRHALRLVADSATLHLAYAANLQLERNFPEAESQARQSLRLWPENAVAHASLALSLTAQRQFLEAESESREALRIFPGDHAASYALSLSLARQHKYEEAIPVLQDAIADLPKIPELRKLLGTCLFETGEIDKGISQLNWYVKNMPDDAEGHYYLGAALRSRDFSQEARFQFAEAFRLQPNNPQYEAAAHPDTTQSATGAGSPAIPESGSSISENIYTNNFFGFTYEFPKDWATMGSGVARSALELAGASILTGDPTDEDVRKAASRKIHPLLYVVEGRVGNQPSSTKSVLVSAFDAGSAMEMTPESVVESFAQRYKQVGMSIKSIGTPYQLTIGGRSFWKGTFAIQKAVGTVYGSQFVTTDKGYLVRFSVSGPDLASLHEIEKSLESVRFIAGSN
jgi:tetratricopeptide (TPR) repeat protein